MLAWREWDRCNPPPAGSRIEWDVKLVYILMVTRAAIDRLGARIEALAAIIDPDAGEIKVAVFAGETPEFALRRHCELRPEHAGRRVRYDHRPADRDELHELCATWAGATEADFQDFRRLVAEISTSDGGRQFVEEFAGQD